MQRRWGKNLKRTQARNGPGLYAESVQGGGSPATGQVRTVAGTAIEVRWTPLVFWSKLSQRSPSEPEA
jgi:hypothetical protein